MDYVIIGNGVAGTTAAKNIRKLDGNGTVTIISDEDYPFYSRIRLIDYIAGTATEEDLVLKNSDWYDKNAIKLILNDPVTDIDLETNEIKLRSGNNIHFNKILLSTGGNPFVPPIPGAGLKNVFVLRKMRDGQKIFEQTKDGGKNVVVIGGGVLGLEAGNSLRKIGNNVTVVEFFSRLLPRQMDPEGAEVLKSQMEEMGFKFYLGAKSKEIIGDGIVEALILDDGTRIDCDVILISAGIRPASELPEKLGLKMERGLPVNNKMETEIPDIYAAGDLIQHNGITYGIWPASEKQGEVAGLNMAGGNSDYEGTTISNKLKVVGIDLMAAGDIDADGNHESIIKSDPEKYIYKKLVLKDNTIIGTILYGGVLTNWQKILKAIETKKDVSDIISDLSDWNLEKL